ncbi:hypothetical protein BX600DRAFT_530428 [Xylariales sp. PMI_506]|nr:hypothetical protein BX600DRAFT_530428 [Xylariales sp. PMI_506]
MASALAKKNGFSRIWIDTCCIDKTSSAELSEAINSMYQWYQNAAVCYFSRGWTLQELIAPHDVEFFAHDWSYLGNKQESNIFAELLNSITGIHGDVLPGILPLIEVSIASRMKWAALRQTTRVEDIAYSLLGIFGVRMPLLYGEGSNAFLRLQQEILRSTRTASNRQRAVIACRR